MYLAPGLTPEVASRICSTMPRPVLPRPPPAEPTAPEVLSFRRTRRLSVELTLHEAEDGSGAVAFLEHAGECCPMLDHATSVCRIYADRPHRCREFPDKLRPGCAISGGCVTVSSGAS